MLFPALLLAAALGLHPNSLSTSRVLVEGKDVTVTLRCQGLSLVEVVPSVDANGDGIYSAAEVAASEAELREYIAGHYRVSSGEERLELKHYSAKLRAGDPTSLFDAQLVDFTLGFEATEPLREVVLDVELFLLTSPDHRDLCQVQWYEREAIFAQFDADQRQWRGPPADPNAPAPGGSVLGSFFTLGVDHILSGWDHLAFLAALFLSTRGLRALFGVVTAFTLAHSVTLAIASLTDIELPGRMIEIVIALSIAYVAADNLLRPAARARWPEAFVFGLVHGLGFAGFLGESLLAASSQTAGLIGFNLGVEAGQLAVVCVLALVFRWMPRPAEPLEEGQRPFLVPVLVRRIGNMTMIVLGLYWFVERAWL